MIIKSLVRTILTWIQIIVTTFLAAIFGLLYGLFINPFSPVVNGVIRIWAKGILWVSGTKLHVEGHEKLEINRPYIYMSNHLSTFDILALMKILPGTIRFIAKKELFKLPIFGHGMAAVGMIKIDRGNSAEARKTINKTLDTIKKGVSVIIFPEGTRSRDGKIHKFKKGGFILALNGHIPIVPVSISGSQYVNRKKSLLLTPGRIKIRILDAIDTSDMKFDDRHRLLDTVYQQIVSNYDSKYNSP